MLQAQPTLSLKDLCVGDVIFFMDYNNQSQHVGIFAGEKNGVPFISHGISKPYDSVMTTRLKADDYPYRVIRCQDFNLAAQAFLRMNSWVKSGLPFSYDKHDNLFMKLLDDRDMAHPKTGGKVQANYARQEFDKSFYRYIDMASHPRFPFMVNAQQQEGAICSEAVVMAFNLETLLMVDAVHACKHLGYTWLSDKTTMPIDVIKKNYHPSTSYLDYVQRRNDVDEYSPYGRIPENGIKDGYFAPSIAAWNYDKYPDIDDFKATYPFPLPLDSKVTTPHGLLTYMLDNPSTWLDLGQLTVESKPYALQSLEADKQAWKEYVLQLFDTRKDTLDQFCSRTRSLSLNSPELNPSPLCFSGSFKGRKRSSSLPLLKENDEDTQNHTVVEANKALDKRVAKHASPKKRIQNKTALKPGVLDTARPKARRTLKFD